MSWDANRNNICYRQYVGTRRWGGVAAYCITILETEVKILDIELQVRKNELSRWRRVVGAGRKSQLPHRERDRRGYSTSSRIFFHIIRVISSPSSSTSYKPERKGLHTVRRHATAKPREKAVAANRVKLKCGRARGSRPRRGVPVRASWEAGIHEHTTGSSGYVLKYCTGELLQ